MTGRRSAIIALALAFAACLPLAAALRRGELGRMTLRVHLVDTSGHSRTYRRAVRTARR